MMKDKKMLLPMINPKAAGIDIGSRMHVVAVDQNTDNVRSFGVYTKVHHDIISYLNLHGITTVAMESTGSYWQSLFSDFQRSCFEVILTFGSQTKNVKGKKTDVIDAIWIQKLDLVFIQEVFYLMI
ncbi:IS110 family transposase [Leeuwenhoekiella aestuarii]|nr:transposase [Leeuwenhoekiella aestuarii]